MNVERLTKKMFIFVDVNWPSPSYLCFYYKNIDQTKYPHSISLRWHIVRYQLSLWTQFVRLTFWDFIVFEFCSSFCVKYSLSESDCESNDVLWGRDRRPYFLPPTTNFGDTSRDGDCCPLTNVSSSDECEDGVVSVERK